MFKKVCVIGEGVTSLIITKMLLELDLQVDLISQSYEIKKRYHNRALAISHSNMEYLDRLNIFKKKTYTKWNVNGINLFNCKEKSTGSKIFDFYDKIKPLFIMVKNYDLDNILKEELKNNKLLQIYSNKKAGNIIKKIVTNKKKYNKSKYSIIFNCDSHNILNKKFFSKKIKKSYFATSFTSFIGHQKTYNKVASQFFMPQGPLAFLPLSEKETSAVWSINNKYLFANKRDNYEFFKNKIKKITLNGLKEISFSEINEHNLNFLISREYYYENILNFGEGLHQIHPLAGQGLNMTIRDIKTLHTILKKNIELGLDLSSAILADFSKTSKSYNFLFAKGIDLTERYFSNNNKILSRFSDKLIKNANKNYFIKNFLIKVADKGIDKFNY